MSQLEELLQTLCPDGVEYRELGDVGKFFGGLTGKSKEDFQNGNRKFISYMNVYKNPSVDITAQDFVSINPDERQNEVNFGDILFTGSSETPEECGISSVMVQHPDVPIYLNSFTIGFRFQDSSKLIPDFSKHLFRSSELRKQINKTASGVTRFNVSKARMSKVVIPIPPLPVQEEIVRILDTFSGVVAELEAEQAARTKQYGYYRELLFNFDGQRKIAIQWLRLSDIADIGTGSSNTNEEMRIGEYPFFVRSQEVRSKDSYEFDETAIITSGDGVGVGKIFHFIEGKYALHQRAYRIHITDERVLPRYFFNYMKNTFLAYIEKNSFHSSVTSIRRPMLNNFPVPVPTLDEQVRIITILDRFDTLVNDLKSGFPAEIALRRKQYEYYRDKLLTFQPLK